MLTLTTELQSRIAEMPQQYHQLILLLTSGSPQAEEMTKSVMGELGVAYINLGLDLSRKLLELTERQRSLRLPLLVNEILADQGEEPVLLDHIEILFSTELKQDPLRLLQGMSRNRDVLAVWNGAVVNGYLTYATPGHPEYRRYSVQGLNMLSLLDYLA